MKRRPAHVAVGPTGIGYSCEVDTLPARDQGCVADRVSALLVWDAAAVAHMLADTCDAYLITNHLGQTPESTRLRRYLSDRVTLVEPTRPATGYPFDVVISERRTGSRSWISTGYVPASEHVVSSLTKLCTEIGGRTFLHLYADVPPGYDTLTAVVEAVSAVERPPEFILLNVGDIADLTQLCPLSVMSTVPVQWVAQASYNTGRRLGSVARAIKRVRARLDPGRANIMLTLGARGVVHAHPERTEIISATPILPAATVGAGAVFSAAVLKASMYNGAGVDRAAIEHAVNEATKHVAAITANTGQNRLRIW